MRSESEVAWVRARTWEKAGNLDGENEIATDWHAIVPGEGDESNWPGVACGAVLTGTLQWTSHAGVTTRDGKVHAKCMTAAKRFIKGIVASPGPWTPDEEPETFAVPGSNT